MVLVFARVVVLPVLVMIMSSLPVADNVKVLKGVYDKDTKTVKAGDPIEGGLKSDTFTKIDAEKGVRATIITDADNKKITEIRVGGRRGKGKE